MDILALTVSAVMTGLSVFIASWLMLKWQKKALMRSAEEWLNSEKGQKAIYAIGVLMGNAIKQGVGLGTSGGKMKLENLLVQAGLGWLQTKGILPGGQQNIYEQPQQ